MAVTGSAQASDENLAKGRPYVFRDQPGYPYCTDSGDAVQLTDGEFTSPPDTLWVQKPAVGWRSVIPVVFTVDLGKVQPISGAMYSTAADSSVGANWPSSIFILVSDNEKVWRRAGDLVKLSHKEGRVQPRAGYFRFKSDQLNTRGRYVQFVVVPDGIFTFCDEIEIYSGPNSLLTSQITGPIVTDVIKLARIAATNMGIERRLRADVATVRNRLAGSRLPSEQKKALSGRLDAVVREIPNIPDVDPDTFRTTYPMNNLQAEIFAVNGVILRESGFPVLTVSKTDRYEYFAPLESPRHEEDVPALSIDMMGNEFRSDSFLLTNASEQPIPAKIRVQSLPGGESPQWLTVSTVPWTDTAAGVPVAAALLTVAGDGGGHPITLPTGLTSKVWFTVDSSSLEPGEYRGNVVIESNVEPISIPFNLRISAVRMNKPRLSLGMWDYSPDGRYGPNTAKTIQMMRSHFVDSPWSTLDVLPWPDAGYFDASGNLVKPLRFDALDKWIQQWPGARHYFVFANVSEEFAGKKAGTEEFNVRVGNWAKALAEHMFSRGLKPEQLGLLLVDEPGNEEQERRVVNWGKAIRTANQRPMIFQDRDLELDSSKADYFSLQNEATSMADIICPQFKPYHAGGEKEVQYYEGFRQEGKELWYYQCMGPTKSYSPQVYYRLLAWHAFTHHMMGISFWAFFDKGNAISSWNEYESSGVPFTPVFLDPKGITTGLHWEAVREGIEDHEYLSMLREAADRTTDTKLKSQAASLLNSINNGLAQRYVDDYAWSDTNANRFQPDGYRVQVLRLLEKFNGNQPGIRGE
jgi:hypothetical protein